MNEWSYFQFLARVTLFFAQRVLRPFMVSLLISCISAPALAASYHPDVQQVRKRLLTAFHHWEGTPYRYGGNNRHGIDCSGFAQAIYRQAFGINVPRSTKFLSRLHHRVFFGHLRAGDLILFRINRRTLHAGIYIGHGQFIHASKTRGVMLSSLHNSYWRETYFRAVRVIKT